MSSVLLSNDWESDSTGLWQVLATDNSPRIPVYVSEQQIEVAINAQASEESNNPVLSLPFIEQTFTPPLNLRQNEANSDDSPSFFQELRFWLRSSRVDNGQSPDQGFYLSFTVASDTFSQEWFIPVKRKETWELYRFWLGDLPEPLLEAVTSMRISALDTNQSFQVVLGNVIATTPEPIQDVDAELLNRLDNRFQVAIQNELISVPAFLELPENPGDRTRPYILITPWSVQLQRERGGSGEITDNYRRTQKVLPEGGSLEVIEVAQRPAMKQVLLEYAIDIFADNRLQKAQLLDSVLADFSRHLYLVINLEPLTVTSFNPSPERATEFAVPGRTPLYLQVTVDVEAGDRRFTTLAERPVVQYNHLDEGEPAVTQPEAILI